MGLRLSDLDAKTAARIQAQMDLQAPAKILTTTYHFVTAYCHLKNTDMIKLAELMDAWYENHPLIPYTVYQTESFQ